MTKQKLMAMTGLALLSSGVLAACSNQASQSTEKVYNYVYTTDPDSLDYIFSNRATTSTVTTQGIDGLLENDKYGNLVPSLAEDWTVSSDGLTYTYKLREGVYWYTADGEEYAEVTAEDFVTGLKHAADKKSEALYVIENSIKGLADYLAGTTTDFSTVGIEAVDKYTVKYTLNQPESFWNSKTTYGILAPVNADFLASQGDKFGSVDPSSILYNGPFIIKAITSKSVIEYEKNTNYWDAETVKLDKIKLTYYDGSDPSTLYSNFAKGTYTATALYPNTPSYSDAKEAYGDNIIYGRQDGATYFLTFNQNRTAYQFTEKTSDTQKSDSQKAMANKDFRQAIAFAFDRTSYIAQRAGEDAGSKSIRNSLVPPTFVQVDGADFGSLVEKELTSYGSEWADVSLDDAQDAFYNPDKAKAEFAKAKEALTAQGVTFPIQLDLPAEETDTVGMQMAGSLKQSIEASLGTDNIQINIIEESTDDFDRTTYFAETADQQDWDIRVAGWGPDYQDPSTYLDIFNTVNGSYVLPLGLEAGKDADLAKSLGLDAFDKLIEEASKMTLDIDARYQAYAKAQAWLTDSSFIIPIRSAGGTPALSKVKPFTASYSWTGLKGDDSFKYYDLQDQPVTAADYQAAYDQWLKEKEASNQKAQENLANHIKD